jgi:hypothetical protein
MLNVAFLLAAQMYNNLLHVHCMNPMIRALLAASGFLAKCCEHKMYRQCYMYTFELEPPGCYGARGGVNLQQSESKACIKILMMMSEGRDTLA